MKNLFLMGILSLTLMACNRQDKAIASSETEYNNDNTGKNVRDRNSMTITPLDQSENEVDRKITQQIREAIIAEHSLSTNAKNIKIITINGSVTLRGPVANAKEKDIIAKKVNDIKGVLKVDNQLEVTNNN